MAGTKVPRLAAENWHTCMSLGSQKEVFCEVFDLYSAQRTAVRHCANFLNNDEIQFVHALAERAGKLG